MARPRSELQSLFESMMSEYQDGTEQHVWFQPPSSVYLTYPCIIYNLSGKDSIYADDLKYLTSNKYTVTVIGYDPDMELLAELEELPYCSFDRQFSIDGLYHTTYTLYF